MNWKNKIDNENEEEVMMEKFNNAWEMKKRQIITLIKEDFTKYFEDNNASVEASNPNDPYGESVTAIYRNRKILLNIGNPGIEMGVGVTSTPGFYCKIIVDYTGENMEYSVMTKLKETISLDESLDERIKRITNSEITFELFSPKEQSEFLFKELVKYDSFYKALESEL